MKKIGKKQAAASALETENKVKNLIPDEIVFHSDYHPENHKSHRFRKIFGHWLGLFFVLLFAILIYYCLTHLSFFYKGLLFILGLIKPVIYGLVIAYLLNPMMKLFQRFFDWLVVRKQPEEKKEFWSGFFKGVSIFLAFVFGIVIIGALIWLIVPQVIRSISTLTTTLPPQAEAYYNKIRRWVLDNPYIANQIQDFVLRFTGSLDDLIQNNLFPWLQKTLLPNVNSVASGVANSLFNVLGVFYNLLIGAIVAVYLLGSKEKFIAQAKKLIYALFGCKQANLILHYSRLTNDMFSGFINGKLVDSTIIGVICFVAMSIFRLPYALLISVIVGVTNVIPVFGPYIGAIPSALLILIVSPMQCLYFVIMIVVLQQLDGNVIGPTILGESTGLSAFWVLFAILVFGGMWGIVGMLIGVPLFAIIYRLIKDIMEWRLYHKRLSTDTDMYEDVKSISIGQEGDEHYILYTREEKQNEELRRKAEQTMTLQDILDPRLVTTAKPVRDQKKKEKIEEKPLEAHQEAEGEAKENETETRNQKRSEEPGR